MRHLIVCAVCQVVLQVTPVVGEEPWHVRSPDCTVLAVPSEYGTIGEALAAASYCDTVLVSAGTYQETIYMPWGVTLESVRGPDSTVIDGSYGGGATIYIGYSDGDNRAEDGQPAAIDGFTVTGGTDAGIKIQGCNPEIKHCIVMGNSGLFGAGLRCLLGSPDIVNCTFCGNSMDVYGWGGTIYCDGSSPAISNCIVALAINGRAAYCCNGSAPTFTCCDVFGNPGGDEICGNDGGGNLSENPLFCDQVGGDVRLCASSPCLPENNSCGALIGALGLGDCPCPECGALVVPYEYKTIGKALAVAEYCDTVLVYPGIYKERLSIPAGVTLKSVAGRDSTEINGEAQGAVVLIGYGPRSGDEGEYSRSTIDGFTICGGSDSGVKTYDSRGVIKDCRITGNWASHGGGIHAIQSSLEILGCDFSLNNANSGGGISSEQCSLAVVGCQFSDNFAFDQGGAVEWVSYADTVMVVDCTFFDNETAGNGGAIYSGWARAGVGHCVFVRNSAADGGGGAYCISDTPVFGSCTFSENGAAFGGAVCFSSLSVVTVDHCVVAFSTSGASIWAETTPSDLDLACSDVYGNVGGDYVGWWMAGQDGINGNISSDPLFCDLEKDDLTVAAGSPCTSPCGTSECGLIGALGVGCGANVWYINPEGTGDAPTIRAGMDSAACADTVLVGCVPSVGEIGWGIL